MIRLCYCFLQACGEAVSSLRPKNAVLRQRQADRLIRIARDEERDVLLDYRLQLLEHFPYTDNMEGGVSVHRFESYEVQRVFKIK